MERYYGSQEIDRGYHVYEKHYTARPDYYDVGEKDAAYGGQAVRLPHNYLESSAHAAQAKLRHQELALLQHYYGTAAGSGGATKRPLETVPNLTPFAHDLLAKRPRSDMPPAGPVRPQRPGEKECAYYMKTGSCSFGTACRFDHPPWVPPGGAPLWKTGPVAVGYPERPGEPECSFYIRTGSCKFGAKCKFHHPRDHNVTGAGSRLLDARVREEPMEAAIFAHHPQNGETLYRQSSQFHAPVVADMSNGWGEYNDGGDFEEMSRTAAANGLAAAAAAAVSAAKIALGVDDDGIRRGMERGGAYGTPAPLNSKGLPIRPEELECAFYMKSGSCKYGAVCKFHHPEGVTGTSPPAGLHGVQHENADMWMGGAAGFRQYPERPGQPECAFYMKTGTCKFGPGCKFHHPRVRPAVAGPATGTVKSPAPPVKLTLAGLPRREGEVTCAYYMKTGACRYGAACKFDHPPPGEAAAKAAALAARKESSGQEADAAEVQQQKSAEGGPIVEAVEHAVTAPAQEG